MKSFLLSIFLLFGLASAMNSSAQTVVQPQIKTRILFIFDASNSMLAYWSSDVKINVAKKMLLQLIDSLQKVPNTEIALRIYGHQSPVPPQDCNDTKLEVPFGPNNAEAMRRKIRGIEPKGTTPIARSLELCEADFPNDPYARNIIILITDGIEACDGDPCAVSRALQKKGIVLRPFIIGIGLDADFSETFKCVGRVFNAKEEKQFKLALSTTISQALNNTTVQINLLDTYKKPTETNVDMTFYDRNTGQIKYNFIHTINGKGVPDTLVLDPLVPYRMVAHTIPPVTINPIDVEPGKHTVFSTYAPQGSIVLKNPGGQTSPDLQFVVKKQGHDEILNVQKTERTEKYIVGKYDVDILCLPPVSLKGVEVKQSETSNLRIPQPGMLTVSKGTVQNGAIFLENKNDLEFVISLDAEKAGNEIFILQPGNYRIVSRGKFIKETLNTVERRVKIVSGGVETVRVN